MFSSDCFLLVYFSSFFVILFCVYSAIEEMLEGSNSTGLSVLTNDSSDLQHQHKSKHEREQFQEQQVREMRAPKSLHTNRHHSSHQLTSELTLLRECTREALQLCWNEKERLCLEGEVMESRISYLKTKIDRVRNEMISKGVIFGGESALDEEELRLSLVKEGEEEKSIEENSRSGKSLNDNNDENNMEGENERREYYYDTHQEGSGGNWTSVQNNNSGRDNGNNHTSPNLLQGKRFHRQRESLCNSDNSQISQGSGTPHLSRNSMLTMLDACQSWLESHTNAHANFNGANNCHGVSNYNENGNDKGRSSFSGGLLPSIHPMLRVSFTGAANDGMPSRWRARELERAKCMEIDKNEKEEEKRKCATSTTKNYNGGEDDDVSLSLSNPTASTHKNGISQERQEKLNRIQTLRYLIAQREVEIATLEKRTLSVEQETSSLQNEISTLKNSRQHSQSIAEHERNELLKDLHRLQVNNDELETKLLETNVFIEEKKISGELLRSELRQAREELCAMQNDTGRRMEQCETEEKAWRAKWKENVEESVASTSRVTMQQQPQQQQQPSSSQTSQVPLNGGEGGSRVKRYQVPTDLEKGLQDMVDISDDDDSESNDNDYKDEDNRGSLELAKGKGFKSMSSTSLATFTSVMSALTFDDYYIEDILDEYPGDL